MLTIDGTNIVKNNNTKTNLDLRFLSYDLYRKVLKIKQKICEYSLDFVNLLKFRFLHNAPEFVRIIFCEATITFLHVQLRIFLLFCQVASS